MRRRTDIANIPPSPTPTDPWPLPELTRARRAIVVVDVVESVRLMQEDEAGFIERWRRFVHQVRQEVLPQHGGRMVKSLGDGMLLEFADARRGVAAAHVVHAMAHDANTFALRIGAHVGEVVVDELDVYGAGVNLAARLAGLARPSTTLVSASVRDDIVDGIDAEVHDHGECWLKHFDQPQRAFMVAPVSPASDAAALSAAARDMPAFDAPGTSEVGCTLAVLPLATRQPGGRDSCLADLLTDALIATASRDGRLRVVSKLSTAALAGRADAGERVARDLNADYALAGSLSRRGSAVRVALELSDARANRVVWSDSLHARTTVAQDPDTGADLAAQAIDAIGNAILSDQVHKARYQPLPNLPSHALLAGGVNLMHRFGRDDFDRARDLLETLAERSPRHPSPRAWLARWHVFRVVQGWSADLRRDREHALDHCKRALDLDDRSSLALTVSGSVQASLLKAPDNARSLYQRALEINPSEPLAHLLLGTAHAFMGDGGPAVAHASAALGLSPLDPMRFFFDTHAAGAYLAALDYTNAIAHAQRSLRANRLHPSTYRSLAIAQVLSGQGQAARQTMQALLAIEPDFTVGGFMARSPGAGFAHGTRFAQALREAGAPA